MTRPTKFEMMRRNRPKLVKARKSLRERIDEIERAMEQEWGEAAPGEIVEIAEALAADRERQLPIPWWQCLLWFWTLRTPGARA